jgi:hypothetical protein
LGRSVSPFAGSPPPVALATSTISWSGPEIRSLTRTVCSPASTATLSELLGDSCGGCTRPSSSTRYRAPRSRHVASRSKVSLHSVFIRRSMRHDAPNARSRRGSRELIRPQISDEGGERPYIDTIQPPRQALASLLWRRPAVLWASAAVSSPGPVTSAPNRIQPTARNHAGSVFTPPESRACGRRRILGRRNVARPNSQLIGRQVNRQLVGLGPLNALQVLTPASDSELAEPGEEHLPFPRQPKVG